jgi:hypothetical protein
MSSRKYMTNITKDNEKRVQQIRSYIVKHPNLGINALIRELLKDGIPANKDELVAIRRQLKKGAYTALQGFPSDELVREGAILAQLGVSSKEWAKAATDGVLEKVSEKLMAAPTPLRVTLQQGGAEKLQEDQEERERRKKVREEREAEQLERSKAKEEQWAKERAEEAKQQALKSAEAPQSKVVELVRDYKQQVLERLSTLTLPTTTTEQVAQGSQDSEEGRKVRDHWLEDFFLKNPEANSWDASMVLQSVFSISRDQRIVLDIMKQVRELSGLPYRGKRLATQEREEEEEEMKLVPQEAQAVPVYVPPVVGPVTPLPMLLYWPGCGQPEFTSKEHLSQSIDRLVDVVGVKREDIRVFREVKVRTKVVVSTELDE